MLIGALLWILASSPFRYRLARNMDKALEATIEAIEKHKPTEVQTNDIKQYRARH